MKKLIIVLLCMLSGFAFGAEYTVQSVPNPITANEHAFVSNPDGILRPETVQQMNAYIDSVKSRTGAEIAIVAINSIGQADHNLFANELFKEWGIGQAKQDNGLLILFVLDIRKVKIETGYGIEGILPDAISKRIISQEMIPEFKNGNYDAGLMAGLQRIGSVILNEPIQKVAVAPVAWNEILPIATGIYIVLIIFSLVWVINSVKKVRVNPKITTNIGRYKALKSEKTGIISLVALVIPVIGFIAIIAFSKPIFLLLLIPVPFTTIPANIYAKIKMFAIRREPVSCNVCNGTMRILSEKKEDVHLKLAQQFEEQLNAVDYDVFTCDNCDNVAVFTLDKPSAYTQCPKCKTKAFILKDKKTLVAPTYISHGTQRTTFHCKFCGHEEHHNDNIPRLNRSNSAMMGGAAAGGFFGSGGRGGFGGGGFRGGSFGGGMSGGGGASGSW